MLSIHSVLSDVDLEKELLAWLKKRNVDQKFEYIHEWPSVYYKSFVSRKQKDHELYDGRVFDSANQSQYRHSWSEELKNFSTDDICAYELLGSYAELGYSISFISLWCGNAEKEKPLLAKMIAEWFDIRYYGVDSSTSMLQMADETLHDLSMNKIFVHADMMTEEFRYEINELTKKDNIRCFAFLGWTFINPNQTEITENMSNMMGENDILRLQLKARESDEQRDNILVHERYQNFLNNTDIIDNFFYPLSYVGITRKQWVMKMSAGREDHIGALLFRYYFEFTEEVEIEYRNEHLVFLPWERITLIDIRIHYIDKFLEFLAHHWLLVIKNELEKITVLSRANIFFRKDTKENCLKYLPSAMKKSS